MSLHEQSANKLRWNSLLPKIRLRKIHRKTPNFSLAEFAFFTERKIWSCVWINPSKMIGLVAVTAKWTFRFRSWSCQKRSKQQHCTHYTYIVHFIWVYAHLCPLYGLAVRRKEPAKVLLECEMYVSKYNESIYTVCLILAVLMHTSSWYEI